MKPEKSPTAPPHLGFLLLTMGRALRERTRDALIPLGLDTSHIGILYVLSTADPLSQRDLGRILRTDRTTIVKQIDELQTLGLVAREACTDRRINALTLTPAGRKMAKQMLAPITQAESDVFSALPPRDRETLRTLLDRTYQSLPPFET